MPEWFGPKSYGIGCRPVSWQGWLVMALFIGIAIASTQFFKDKPLILASILVPATALFLLVAIKTSSGGCGWRWGGRK